MLKGREMLNSCSLWGYSNRPFLCNFALLQLGAVQHAIKKPCALKDTRVKRFSSRAWFRSTDLWVMGPARFHCATLLAQGAVWGWCNEFRLIRHIIPWLSSLQKNSENIKLLNLTKLKVESIYLNPWRPKSMKTCNINPQLLNSNFSPSLLDYVPR